MNSATGSWHEGFGTNIGLCDGLGLFDISTWVSTRVLAAPSGDKVRCRRFPLPTGRYVTISTLDMINARGQGHTSEMPFKILPLPARKYVNHNPSMTT